MSLLLMLLTSGCLTPLTGVLKPASAPVTMTAIPGKAHLVFLRPEQFVGASLSTLVFDPASRKVWGKSVNGAAFAVDVEPGRYELCQIPFLEGAVRQFTSVEYEQIGVTTPLTRLEVEAGKSYLLQMKVEWGARVEALPVRPGTPREEVLLATLQRVRHAEVASVETLDEKSAAAWADLCRVTSGPTVRLELKASDGR